MVFSDGFARVQDDELVIVRSSVELSGDVERIGTTNFWSVPVSQAREMQASGVAIQKHAVHDYSTTSTNDPLEPQEYLTVLEAADVWSITTGSSEVVVAVIDSGFALEHEDLQGRWFSNQAEVGATASEGAEPNCTSRGLPLDKACNNLDDDTNGLIDDWRGWDFNANNNDVSAGLTDPSGAAVTHGTAVAGMVGATGDNGIGVASINWGATLLPIQVFSDEGEATTFELAQGIAYAIDMGADVINLSLGTLASDDVIEALLQDARDAGIVVVAAAGNCGGPNYELNGCTFEGQMLYPATSEYTIAVAGTTSGDTRASFSSEGERVDIAAPATGNIRTTLYNPGVQAGGYSASIQGTSFASPIVSGLVASMLAQWPDATPRDVRAMLVDTALKVAEMDQSQFTEQLGFGRMRPVDAIELANQCQASKIVEDINCDGTVDLLDLSLLAIQWQLERTGRTDIDNSSVVELLDLSLLASKWGETE